MNDASLFPMHYQINLQLQRLRQKQRTSHEHILKTGVCGSKQLDGGFVGRYKLSTINDETQQNRILEYSYETLNTTKNQQIYCSKKHVLITTNICQRIIRAVHIEHMTYTVRRQAWDGMDRKAKRRRRVKRSGRKENLLMCCFYGV